MAYLDQHKFDLGLLSLGLISSTFLGVHFAQHHSPKLHLGFVSLGFLDTANFDLGFLFLGLLPPKFIWDRFIQPHSTNIHIYIGFDSLGLLDPNILSCVSFPPPGFSKI